MGVEEEIVLLLPDETADAAVVEGTLVHLDLAELVQLIKDITVVIIAQVVVHLLEEVEELALLEQMALAVKLVLVEMV